MTPDPARDTIRNAARHLGFLGRREEAEWLGECEGRPTARFRVHHECDPDPLGRPRVPVVTSGDTLELDRAVVLLDDSGTRAVIHHGRCFCCGRAFLGFTPLVPLVPVGGPGVIRFFAEPEADAPHVVPVTKE